MTHPWTAELRRLAFLVLFGLVLGAFLGQPTLVVLVAAAVYIGWHLYHLYQLEKWLRRGRSLYPPEGTGIWGDVFYRLYQLQRRNRKRKKKLAGYLERFQEATEAMPDATVVLDSNGAIEWSNEAASALLGLRPGQDAGQRIDNLLRNPDFVEYLAQEDFNEPLEIPSPCNSGVTLRVRVVPYGRDQRLLLARDISHQQQLEQMRRDFVANVSHELRTPLTVVSGFVENLLEEDDDCSEKWGRSLGLMQQQTRRMQRIVEDLLLLSRLETDRSRPGERVDVPAVMASVQEDARLLSGEQGHTIEAEVDPELRLAGSEKELHSAFGNLVSNAVRYTPAGGRIAVRWFRDQRGAHLQVEDTGEGIPADAIPRLTERFYRVDKGRSRESGGTGLGLAIVKHVLNRHDAQLRIDSTPGQGSTFTCDFPPERIV